jgi:hypothetical protein
LVALGQDPRVPRLGAACVALLLLAAPLVSRSAEAAPFRPGPLFGLRISEGLPFGDLTGDTFPVRQQLVSVTSLGAEATWRFHPAWDAGLTLDVGHAPIAPTICPESETCWGWLGRAVALVRLRVARGASFEPWVAAGAGVTVADVRILSTSQRWQGFEALRLEGGVDLPPRGRFSLGLFLSASLDRFTYEVVHARGYAVESAQIPNRSWHGWVTGGIRGTFEPRRGRSAP